MCVLNALLPCCQMLLCQQTVWLLLQGIKQLHPVRAAQPSSIPARDDHQQTLRLSLFSTAEHHGKLAIRVWHTGGGSQLRYHMVRERMEEGDMLMSSRGRHCCDASEGDED